LGGPSAYPTARETDPLLGRTIGGKFVVERLLGAGAMGAVYRAHQTALDRTVAIKVMHGGLAPNPTYAARFHREAKAVSRLDHPNLIGVFDYGQEPDGLLYIAMEFLDGRDLFTAIEEEWPLTHERMVDILSQTLLALAEAHDAGVLHRDLKPENIMLLRKKSGEGQLADVVKVCDFGMAMVADEAEPRWAMPSSRRRLTAAGLVIGTPGYMAPEQARGESCDARSDIYAVGVILYQLLTRRLPFEGDTPLEVLAKALHEAPPPFGSFGRTAAPGLEPICVRSMSKRPEERYQSAREMRAALRLARPIDEGAMVSARAPTVNAQPRSTLRASADPSGGRSVSRAAAHAPPIRRATGLLAALAIAALPAFLTVKAFRPPSRPEDALLRSVAVVQAPPFLVAPPPTAVPLPVAAAPAPRSSTPSAPSPSDRAPSTPPQPARGRRALREPKGAPASTPEDPLPPAAALPVLPTAPQPAIAIAPAPPVATPPAPIAVATAEPAPVPPPSPALNLVTARVEIGQARTNSAAATSGAVSRAVTPLAVHFGDCYRAALERATTAYEAVATLHVESDDQGYVTVARVSGAVPVGAARCIERLVTGGTRIDVDTGTANADVFLIFKPR
jgi:serine/threonine protein kinase